IGSAVALIALLSGPMVIVIAAASTYHMLREIPFFQAAMAGIACAAVGMIFRLGILSARGALRHLPSALVLLAAFGAVGIMQWPLAPVLLVLAPISVAAAWWRTKPDA